MKNKTIALYPYQKAYIQDKSRYKIACFARQCGKSFTASLEILLEAVRFSLRREAHQFMLMSLTKRQAKLILKHYMRMHLEHFMRQSAQKQHQSQACHAFHAFFQSIRMRESMLELPFGVCIHVLPAMAESARGFSGSVLLDEFAFHPDDEAIWQAIFPVISEKGTIRILSTPNGKGNVFHTLTNSPSWSVHWCDIHKAIAQGLPRDVHSLKNALCSSASWKREYELSFDASLDEALDASLIEKSMQRTPHIDASLPCYVGIDIARRNDYFAMWVLAKGKEGLYTQDVIVKKDISFAQQAALLDEVMHAHRVVRVHIDQGGMGEKPVEDAKKRFGRRIHGIHFTPASKHRLVRQAKDALKECNIQMPNMDALRQAFGAIKEKPHPKWGALYTSTRSEQGHADQAWACLLALDALYAQGSFASYQYESIR